MLPAQILVSIDPGLVAAVGTHRHVELQLRTEFHSTTPTRRSTGRDASRHSPSATASRLIVNALAGKLAQAGCFRAVADAYLGEQVSWRSSLRYALRRLPAVIGAQHRSRRSSSGSASSLCVIPGIYLWGAFYVAVPVLLVEGVGPMRALGRSRQLVRGRWWGTIGVAVVGSLLVFLDRGRADTGSSSASRSRRLRRTP